MKKSEIYSQVWEAISSKSIEDPIAKEIYNRIEKGYKLNNLVKDSGFSIVEETTQKELRDLIFFVVNFVDVNSGVIPMVKNFVETQISLTKKTKKTTSLQEIGGYKIPKTTWSTNDEDVFQTMKLLKFAIGGSYEIIQGAKAAPPKAAPVAIKLQLNKVETKAEPLPSKAKNNSGEKEEKQVPDLRDTEFPKNSWAIRSEEKEREEKTEKVISYAVVASTPSSKKEKNPKTPGIHYYSEVQEKIFEKYT